MAFPLPRSSQLLSRRNFLKAGLGGAAGMVLYSGEIERHWIEVVERDLSLRGLAGAFEGMRVVQISDIHMDDFTEPIFLRHVIDRINQLKPDAVLLTGDFVTTGHWANKFAHRAVWECANILSKLECRPLYAALGNHDIGVGAGQVTAALAANGVTVLRNAYLPIERAGARIWLAGLDDPLIGHPNLEAAIPASIRNVPNEPIVLMCHGPDYADRLLTHPAGQAVDLMLSGHTHGGQIRLPLLGALVLPPMGRKFVEGWFQLGRMQLYVNRGIGTIGVPLRFDCPPEITLFTLHAGA
jgi:uncharacterized protein